MNTLTQEEKVVLQLVNNGINGCNKELNFENCDYSKVFKIIDLHSVNMIAFEGTKGIIDKLPNAIYTKWMYQASRKLSSREKIVEVQKKLTSVLEKNNINYLVFKGLCSASYYIKPELRECGDVDFYVDFNDFSKADKCLVDAGFTACKKDEIKHWNYKFDGVSLEMHFGYWKLAETNAANYLDELLNNSINNYRIYNFDDYEFKGPNVVEHAVMLLLHIIIHMQKGGIGLRHLCDFAVFLSSDDFKNQINEIISVYKKGGIYKIACVVGYISYKYLGTPYYSFIDNVDEKTVNALLLDIMKSGNFGNLSKDLYRGSSIFTSNKSQENFIQGVFDFCKTNWKPCDKYKFLIPIAPLYIGIRFIYRTIKGKRPKINFFTFSKTGFSRAKLYKNLEFFKDNDNE